MKRLSFRPADLLVSCGLVVVANVILFEIMARTQVIEKVMAGNFAWPELVSIVLFLACRIITYLVVPSALVAMGVYALTRRLLKNR